MPEKTDDEKKVTIKTSLLVGLIIFAVILLITVVFLFGFLIGSGMHKQTIVTEIDEFTIGNSSGNKENVTITTKKEDTNEDSNKKIGFIPLGSQKHNQTSNPKSKSSENEKEDTRNLSALFTPVEEENNSSYNNNSTYSSKNNNVSSESGKEAVKKYFIDLESKLSGGKTWSDPNQFAEQLLRSAMSGDFSELNDLTGNMTKITNEIENMNVPIECVEHRNSVVESLRYSTNVLTKVKNGIDNGDVQMILSLTADAEKIKSTAEKSDRLMKELKSKYGF